jgi:hypothetical protein
MQSVLPSNINIKYWAYTLVGLFLMTTILVINLPHITTFIQFLRGWQDWYWGRLWDVVRSRGRVALEEEEEEESGDEGLEMDELGGSERNGGVGGEV